MDVNKQSKSSKNPAYNQTSRTLDIPKETIEKAIKEKKILLLNVKGEELKVQCVKSINRFIVDPRNSLTQEDYESLSGFRMIDCRLLEKKQIIDELGKYIDIHNWLNKHNVTLPDDERLKYFSFYTLYIKDLRESDYDNRVAVKLQKLKDKIKGNGKRKSYIKLITSRLENINETIKEEDGLYSTVLIHKVKGCDDVNIMTDRLTEDDKNEIEEYSNDVPIGKTIEGIKLRKNEKYKLIMESPCIPTVLIISFLHGKVPDEFRQEFKNEFEEMKVKSKHINDKKGNLKKGGKTVYLPDKELMLLLNGILKEFKGSSHTLSELAEMAQKRIKDEHGVRTRKTDFKRFDYYSVSKLKMFLSKLRNTGKLR